MQNNTLPEYSHTFSGSSDDNTSLAEWPLPSHDDALGVIDLAKLPTHSPEDAGVYVSADELAHIVEMKAQFDQSLIDLDQAREDLRVLRESYDSYKTESERKVMEAQEEARQAYEQRMLSSRELQLARTEAEEAKAKLSAKLSEFQLLRHDHAATNTLLSLTKKELEAEKAHAAALADQLREAGERISALVEVDRDQDVAAAKADEVRVQILQRACARAQTELAREREQSVALRKAIEKQQREVAEVNRTIQTLEREAVACLPIESDLGVEGNGDVHASIGAETSNTLNSVKRRLTAVRERLRDAGREDVNDDEAVWQARREGLLMVGGVLTLAIMAIGAALAMQ